TTFDMFGVILVLCSLTSLVLCVCVQPSCVGMTVTQACPLSYSPVCGSNGITYPNECSLCVARLEKNVDILIVNDGPCS
uniref:Kazal-like domain-containing protein n=1 Tax=Amphiprion percula TaxID=161767 RepID=A0A3P8S648_AMPPE